MSNSSDFPTPGIGPYAARYFALRFGAPTDLQTVNGVPRGAAREQFRARLAFEREVAGLRYTYNLRCFGSENGQPEDLHQSVRETVKALIFDRYAVRDASYRKSLHFPTIVRSEGFEDLLCPFVASHEPYSERHNVEFFELSPDLALPEIDDEDLEGIRDSFAAMPAGQRSYFAYRYGSPRGMASEVPSDQKAAFREYVEYQRQSRLSDFETICNAWGASDGFFESIEPSRQRSAFLDLEHQAAEFASAWAYQWKIHQIIESHDETAQPKRKITTADLLADD